MPAKVRWTATADQMLLLKILETHELAVDTNKVAAAWPGDEDSRPTGRAIRERIVKIKEIVKTAPPDGLEEPSTPTPKRSRNKGVAKSTTKGPGSGRGRPKKKVDKPPVKVETVPVKIESTAEEEEEEDENASDEKLAKSDPEEAKPVKVDELHTLWDEFDMKA